MYLINTTTIKIRPFIGIIPKYVILSHTWDEDEVTFESMQRPNERTKALKGYMKIKRCCEQAKQDGYRWAWVDTCCIDKRSSAELSEAINSMYRYYWGAEKCYAYLTDVGDENSGDRVPGIGEKRGWEYIIYGSSADFSHDINVGSADVAYDPQEPSVELPRSVRPEREIFQFLNSRWFKRGWTLQELLAPATLEFYDQEWNMIGTKFSLATFIQVATEIQAQYILDRNAMKGASIGLRLSWASQRDTTRDEDQAYCLFGIMGVNMPLLYGEGKRAFYRLQVELLKNTMDHTIFAWSLGSSFSLGPKSPCQFVGILAATPRDFQSTRLADIRPGLPQTIQGSTHDVTNAGLRIVLPCVAEGPDMLLALLNCHHDKTGKLFLRLRRLDDQRFMRDQDQEMSTSILTQDMELKRKELYILMEPETTLDLKNLAAEEIVEHITCALVVGKLDFAGTAVDEVVAFHRDSRSKSELCWGNHFDVLPFQYLPSLDSVGVGIVYDEVSLTIIFGHRHGNPWLDVVIPSGRDLLSTVSSGPRHRLRTDPEFREHVVNKMRDLEVQMKVGLPSKFCRDHAVVYTDSTDTLEVQVRRTLASDQLRTCWQLGVIRRL
ncbi:hypothetical protein AA0119_g9356 [Alternaria tenuissima]|jgi:hypothetical protein|uniref:Heterokaryon incompatibility domain-containing protein n=1 Tax=Alternaria tenuissima TaxID=119927 RepID=A0AB37W658_9PLEO|nr:hypothetical protein AA0115_g9774 [Alternaria tenuissima]RYN94159.1 hypothetical protein AA0119_g9356 [Alternaria tenuissima]RYO10766.1 hypothetical protein AA0121_g10507 [Alternaria tenuissima]